MAVIRYVSDGRKHPPVNIAISVNGGRSWRTQNLAPGQSFPIPVNVTNLLIDNVPYQPNCNYDIRQGRVSQR